MSRAANLAGRYRWQARTGTRGQHTGPRLGPHIAKSVTREVKSLWHGSAGKSPGRMKMASAYRGALLTPLALCNRLGGPLSRLNTILERPGLVRRTGEVRLSAVWVRVAFPHLVDSPNGLTAKVEERSAQAFG